MPISLQEQTPCPVAPLQEDLRVTMRAADENAASSATSARNTKPPGAATTPQQAEIGLPDDTDDTPAAVPIMLEWPADLPAQVPVARKLLPAVGHDPETLAACFGRKNKKRTDQITGILATLKALGLIT